MMDPTSTVAPVTGKSPFFIAGRPILTAVLTAWITFSGPLVSQASAVEIIGSAGRNLSLEINKGRLVRLSRPAGTVFVANPEIADIQVKSPSLVYLMGRAAGETTLFAVDENEKVLANFEISVTPDLIRLRESIHQLHPDEEITVNAVDGSVVLDGVVHSATTAENIRRLASRIAGSDEAVITRLAVDAPNQVNLRVRVAEVGRGVDKQLGFNWQILGSLGSIGLGVATFNPFAANVATNALNLAFDAGGFNFNGIVDALEDEGLITILAEPNLTAMSGETASFLAGGEFPILVPDSNGRVTIEFKKFGVSLAFTPTVLGDSQVSMRVRPEVSQLSNANAVTLNGFNVPSLVTRRAETTVELGSGQSFAIAGLLQNNVTHDISKFPGLGDVPVLGGLFRSDRFQRDETELVIIVTPYIVRPVARAQISSPTDGYAPPHDVDRHLVGGTHRQQARPSARRTIDTRGNSLIGPVGFQLD